MVSDGTEAKKFFPIFTWAKLDQVIPDRWFQPKKAWKIRTHFDLHYISFQLGWHTKETTSTLW